MNGARNLNSRINRLEQTLGTLPCNCPDSADLGNLSDNELDQLKRALQVVEEAAPQA